MAPSVGTPGDSADEAERTGPRPRSRCGPTPTMTAPVAVGVIDAPWPTGHRAGWQSRRDWIEAGCGRDSRSSRWAKSLEQDADTGHTPPYAAQQPLKKPSDAGGMSPPTRKSRIGAPLRPCHRQMPCCGGSPIQGHGAHGLQGRALFGRGSACRQASDGRMGLEAVVPEWLRGPASQAVRVLLGWRWSGPQHPARSGHTPPPRSDMPVQQHSADRTPERHHRRGPPSPRRE